MFTPRSFSVGDRVTINKDISTSEGTYGAGHAFTIIDVRYHGNSPLFDLRDHELHLVGNVPVTDLTRDQGE